MKKTSLSGKSPQTRVRGAADDIPEALRDTPIDNPTATVPADSGFKGTMAILLGLGSVAVLGLAGVGWYVWQSPPQTVRSPDTTETTATDTAQDTQAPDEENPNLLGHLPYEEASPNDLEPIVADNSILLRREAAEAYLNMEADARAEGVRLAPLSGFRTVEDQQYLFFEVKAERGQVASERAEVSAPPGYSEHHTGYAIDIGDADVPATHLSPDFENTRAFEWLEANAAYYSFELSFPKDNPQNIAYEPWHWRFVGDRDSLETFYKARELARPEGE